MSKLRITSAIMTVLFFACAAIQVNDPDPVPWMAIYGAAAVVSAWYARRSRVPRALPSIVAVAALAWAAFIVAHLHGPFEWRHLAETMHAGTPAIEESRESLGLLIVAGWMIVLAVAPGSPRSAAAPSADAGAARK